jgi:hypothetical protein
LPKDKLDLYIDELKIAGLDYGLDYKVIESGPTTLGGLPAENAV